MLLCHFKFSFKEDKLNFRFIGTLKWTQNVSQQFFHSINVMRQMQFLCLTLVYLLPKTAQVI